MLLLFQTDRLLANGDTLTFGPGAGLTLSGTPAVAVVLPTTTCTITSTVAVAGVYTMTIVGGAGVQCFPAGAMVQLTVSATAMATAPANGAAVTFTFFTSQEAGPFTALPGWDATANQVSAITAIPATKLPLASLPYLQVSFTLLTTTPASNLVAGDWIDLGFAGVTITTVPQAVTIGGCLFTPVWFAIDPSFVTFSVGQVAGGAICNLDATNSPVALLLKPATGTELGKNPVANTAVTVTVETTAHQVSAATTVYTVAAPPTQVAAATVTAANGAVTTVVGTATFTDLLVSITPSATGALGDKDTITLAVTPATLLAGATLAAVTKGNCVLTPALTAQGMTVGVAVSAAAAAANQICDIPGGQPYTFTLTNTAATKWVNPAPGTTVTFTVSTNEDATGHASAYTTTGFVLATVVPSTRVTGKTPTSMALGFTPAGVSLLQGAILTLRAATAPAGVAVFVANTVTPFTAIPGCDTSSVTTAVTGGVMQAVVTLNGAVAANCAAAAGVAKTLTLPAGIFAANGAVGTVVTLSMSGDGTTFFPALSPGGLYTIEQGFTWVMAYPNDRTADAPLTAVTAIFLNTVALAAGQFIELKSTPDFVLGQQVTGLLTVANCQLTPTWTLGTIKYTLGACGIPANTLIVLPITGTIGKNPPANQVATFALQTSTEGSQSGLLGWQATTTSAVLVSATPNSILGLSAITTIAVTFRLGTALGPGDWLDFPFDQASVVTATSPTLNSNGCTLTAMLNPLFTSDISFIITQTAVGTPCSIPAGVDVTLPLTVTGMNPTMGTPVGLRIETSQEAESNQITVWTASGIELSSVVPSTRAATKTPTGMTLGFKPFGVALIPNSILTIRVASIVPASTAAIFVATAVTSFPAIPGCDTSSLVSALSGTAMQVAVTLMGTNPANCAVAAATAATAPTTLSLPAGIFTPNPAAGSVITLSMSGNDPNLGGGTTFFPAVAPNGPYTIEVGFNWIMAYPDVRTPDTNMNAVTAIFRNSVALGVGQTIILRSTPDIVLGQQVTGVLTVANCQLTPAWVLGTVTYTLAGVGGAACSIPINTLIVLPITGAPVGKNPAANQLVTFTLQTSTEGAQSGLLGWRATTTSAVLVSATPNSILGLSAITTIAVKFRLGTALGPGDWLDFPFDQATVVTALTQPAASNGCTFTAFLNPLFTGDVSLAITQTAAGTPCSLPAATELTLPLTVTGANPTMGTPVGLRIETSQEAESNQITVWTASGILLSAVVPSTRIAARTPTGMTLGFSPFGVALAQNSVLTIRVASIIPASASPIFAATNVPSTFTAILGCDLSTLTSTATQVAVTLKGTVPANCAVPAAVLGAVPAAVTTLSLPAGIFAPNPAAGSVVTLSMSGNDPNLGGGTTFFTAQELNGPYTIQLGSTWILAYPTSRIGGQPNVDVTALFRTAAALTNGQQIVLRGEQAGVLDAASGSPATVGNCQLNPSFAAGAVTYNIVGVTGGACTIPALTVISLRIINTPNSVGTNPPDGGLTTFALQTSTEGVQGGLLGWRSTANRVVITSAVADATFDQSVIKTITVTATLKGALGAGDWIDLTFDPLSLSVLTNLPQPITMGTCLLTPFQNPSLQNPSGYVGFAITQAAGAPCSIPATDPLVLLLKNDAGLGTNPVRGTLVKLQVETSQDGLSDLFTAWTVTGILFSKADPSTLAAAQVPTFMVLRFSPSVLTTNNAVFVVNVKSVTPTAAPIFVVQPAPANGVAGVVQNCETTRVEGVSATQLKVTMSSAINANACQMRAGDATIITIPLGYFAPNPGFTNPRSVVTLTLQSSMPGDDQPVTVQTPYIIDTGFVWVGADPYTGPLTGPTQARQANSPFTTLYVIYIAAAPLTGGTITLSATSPALFTAVAAPQPFTIGTCQVTPQAPAASAIVMNVAAGCTIPVGFVWLQLSMASGNLGVNPPPNVPALFTLQTSAEGPQGNLLGWFPTNVPATWVSAVPNTLLGGATLNTVTVRIRSNAALAAGDWIWVAGDGANAIVLSATPTPFDIGACTLVPVYIGAPLNGVTVEITQKAGQLTPCSIPINTEIVLPLANTAKVGTNPAANVNVRMTIGTSRDLFARDNNAWTTISPTAAVWVSAIPSSTAGEVALTAINVTVTPKQTQPMVAGDFITLTANPQQVLSAGQAAPFVRNSCLLTPSVAANGTMTIAVSQNTAVTTACSIPPDVALVLPLSASLGTNPTSGTTVQFTYVSTKDTIPVTGTGWVTTGIIYGSLTPDTLVGGLVPGSMTLRFRNSMTLNNNNKLTLTVASTSPTPNLAVFLTKVATAFNTVYAKCETTTVQAPSAFQLIIILSSATATNCVIPAGTDIVMLLPAGYYAPNPVAGTTVVTTLQSDVVGDQNLATVQLPYTTTSGGNVIVIDPTPLVLFLNTTFSKDFVIQVPYINTTTPLTIYFTCPPIAFGTYNIVRWLVTNAVSATSVCAIPVMSYIGCASASLSCSPTTTASTKLRAGLNSGNMFVTFVTATNPFSPAPQPSPSPSDSGSNTSLYYLFFLFFLIPICLLLCCCLWYLLRSRRRPRVAEPAPFVPMAAPAGPVNYPKVEVPSYREMDYDDPLPLMSSIPTPATSPMLP